MLALSVVLALTSLPGAAAWPAADTVLWRYTAGQEIVFLRLTPMGSVVVSTIDGMVALDPATGQVLWRRDDIKNLKGGAFEVLPLTPYGVVRSKYGIAVLDLQSGATRWDSTAVPLQTVRGFFYVAEQHLLLLYGRARPEGRGLVAMDVDSGKVRWEQPALLRDDPELFEADNVQSLGGHQPPIADTDSTLILYINEDGPIKIHAATGQLLWRVDALKGENPPTRAEMYPPLPLGDTVLLVPYGRKLMAVDPRDGRILWNRTKKFGAPLSQIEVTAGGIVVRGARPLELGADTINPPDAFLDFVDLRAGTSLWQKPFGRTKNESLAPFLVVGDTVFVGDKDRLYAVALRDGVAREVARYEFEGGEEPVAIALRNSEEFILFSAHNLLVLNTRGAERVRRYYPAPGTSLLTKLGQAALFVASAMTQPDPVKEQRRMSRPGLHARVTFDYNPFIRERMQGTVAAYEDYTFMYTRAPDRRGREGFSLVRLRKADGEEAGRVWLDERSPTFELDAAAGAVFAKRGTQEVVALKFVQP